MNNTLEQINREFMDEFVLKIPETPDFDRQNGPEKAERELHYFGSQWRNR